MSKLQELLDERWPLDTAMSECDQDHMIYARKLFEAGYNAAIEEKNSHSRIEDYGSREEVEKKVKILRSEGKNQAALKYFRQSPYSVGGLKEDKDYCGAL